ncbi:MAG TPA: hypothetical protein VG454_13025 [Gemmatimonadales bacterium]|nr:hypothetical protein [Gemmatimonadales bacterium]
MAALAGCEHGAPFRPSDYAPTQPFNAPPLVRLTLNPGDDQMPAWLPDGEIVYTAERLDRADHDRCFAVMPDGGAAISRYICRTTASDDSLDVFLEASPTAFGGGQIAYLRQGSYRVPIPPLTPNVQAIIVAPLTDPSPGRMVRSIPYLAPSGRTHWGVSHLRWLDASRLVFVGEDVSYPRPCGSCPVDTVRVGLEIAILDLSSSSPSVTIVPGTDSASSVSVGASSDTIYFTRESDGAVYRHVFSTTTTDTVHDFGAGRLVRDVAWAAGRLFVVVDGDPNTGGEIHILGLATGADSVIRAPSGGGVVMFARPAPSPDAKRFLAQGYIVSNGLPISSREVWLYELP